MNILYFFQEKETPMYQWQRLHIIDELSHHNCHFTFINPLAYSSPEEANEALINHVRDHNYDLFFSNICYHKAIFKDTIERIKERGIPTLCFRSDNLTIPFIDKEVGPSFDLLWLTSKETKYLYDRWGINTMFAPYAANPFFFKYTEPHSFCRNVCFIGTPYGSRPLMINALTEQGIPVDVYYKKNKSLLNNEVKSSIKSNPVLPNSRMILFNRLLFQEGRSVILGSLKNKFAGSVKLLENENMHGYFSVPSDEQPIIYSNHVLAISSTSTKSTDVLKNPLKVINLRAFEIPMSGGIQICKYNPELAEYFEEDKEIVFYRDNEELVDKARYYSLEASESAIRKMKEAARRRAEKEHSWWNRFSLAFDKLGIKH